MNLETLIYMYVETWISQITHIFSRLEVVDRDSETQLQVTENEYFIAQWSKGEPFTVLGPAFFKEGSSNTFNPLIPHDASKHYFTSLKTYLIFLQPKVLEWIFPWNWFTNSEQFS